LSLGGSAEQARQQGERDDPAVYRLRHHRPRLRQRGRYVNVATAARAAEAVFENTLNGVFCRVMTALVVRINNRGRAPSDLIQIKMWRG
jgi:hypothetical protein